MNKLLATLLVLFATQASAQNYLRDDGIFHSVVEGTTNGQCLTNSGGQLAGGACGTPGGPSGAVQFNNSGALGGDAGLTYSAGNALVISPTTNTTNQGLVINQTLPIGSQSSGPYSANQTTITDGGYISTATGFSTVTGLLNGQVSGWRIDYLSAGSGPGQGPIHTGLTVAAAETSQGQQLIGIHGSAATNSASAGSDSIWGITGYAYVGPSANLSSAAAINAQIGVRSGAVLGNRTGVEIDIFGDGAASGGLDTAISIATLTNPYGGGTSTPIHDAINLYVPNGIAPLATTGNVIVSSGTFTIANVISLPNVTCTGNIIDMGGSVFQIGCAGNITSGGNSILLASSRNAGVIYTASNVNAGTSAIAGYVLGNSAGSGGLAIGGTGYTGLLLKQNRVFVDADSGTAGILLNNEGANPTIFATSNSEVARIGAGLMVGNTTDEGAGTVNATGAYYANGTKGVTCSGTLTVVSTLSVKNGIVTVATGTGGTCS